MGHLPTIVSEGFQVRIARHPITVVDLPYINQFTIECRIGLMKSLRKLRVIEK